ncbi:MAG: ABC transporter permease [Anaerolineae bacterium]|nr:ABC transporter permease [Anaerolineae bacterium]
MNLIQPSQALLGFRPLFAKETRKWWGTNRWWVQALLWLVLLNGVLAMTLFVLPGLTTPEGEAVMSDTPFEAGMQVFFGLSAMALAIGVAILTQDEIIGEKEAGTAAWVLSKPISRSAFILSKVTAHAISVTVLMILLPVTGAYILFTFSGAGEVLLINYVIAAALILLHTLFYLMLTLMMGVLATSRGIVLGVSLGFFLIGQLVAGFLPVLDFVTPWLLPNIAVGVGLGGIVPEWTFLPVLASLGWILVFLFITIRQFKRTEL